MRKNIIILKSLIYLIFLFLSSSLYAQISKKTIYLIPGQGSDYRIYKYFKFNDFDTVHIKYIIPEKKESMKNYALRLSSQIDTTKKFSIIGVSLGGMIAVELSDFLNPEKVIIISSAKNRNELPFKYRFIKKVPINKIFGGRFIKAVAPTAQIIVEPDSKKERDLCVSMLRNKNKTFMKRSVNMIINWNRNNNRIKIIHIHGDNDNTIPIKNVKYISHIIKGGSHMMTLTRGKEISELINVYIEN